MSNSVIFSLVCMFSYKRAALCARFSRRSADDHALRDKLTARLIRDGRLDHADACFAFLPTRAKLDLLGWDETDIFAHS